MADDWAKGEDICVIYGKKNGLYICFYALECLYSHHKNHKQQSIMKKHWLMKVWGMMLVGLCLMAGCSDDESAPVVLTDPVEMTAHSFYVAEGDLDILVNGDKLADGYVSFEPVEGDSTQLLMTIGNIVIAHEAQALVNITPGEGVVTFEGTNERLLQTGYSVQVSGTYRAEGEASVRQLQAECELTVGQSMLEVPFEYHFAKGVLDVQSGPGGFVEWQGQTWEKWDFIQSVLDKIVGRIAKEVTDLKLMFHGDGTFDTWLKRAGQADYEPWMTARFWIEGQTMYWYLTPEQHTQFCEQWLGPLTFESISPFRRIEASETLYELPILFWGGSEQFDWTIWNPNRYAALDLYLKGRGMEGLTEEERQEMELFGQVLRDVEDPTYWMAWNIKLYSEPISPNDPDWNR